jgi:hypothetical protein
MNNKRFIIGSTVSLVLLLLLYYRVPTIEVSYNNSKFYLKDDTFEIGWIHSVEKEPWFEEYQLQNNDIYLTKTRLKSFGAGTPSVGKFIPSNDGFVHMRIDRKIEEIHLVISDLVETTLYLDDSIIPLYKLVNDYETVTIKISKLPLWELVRGDFK